jgi:hypothetical protein
MITADACFRVGSGPWRIKNHFLPPIEHALRDDTPYYRLPSTLLTKPVASTAW